MSFLAGFAAMLRYFTSHGCSEPGERGATAPSDGLINCSSDNPLPDPDLIAHCVATIDIVEVNRVAYVNLLIGAAYAGHALNEAADPSYDPEGLS
jgi:hypothetical protein